MSEFPSAIDSYTTASNTDSTLLLVYMDTLIVRSPLDRIKRLNKGIPVERNCIIVLVLNSHSGGPSYGVSVSLPLNFTSPPPLHYSLPFSLSFLPLSSLSSLSSSLFLSFFTFLSSLLSPLYPCWHSVRSLPLTWPELPSVVSSPILHHQISLPPSSC